jgi:hypothetical protein
LERRLLLPPSQSGRRSNAQAGLQPCRRIQERCCSRQSATVTVCDKKVLFRVLQAATKSSQRHLCQPHLCGRIVSGLNAISGNSSNRSLRAAGKPAKTGAELLASQTGRVLYFEPMAVNVSRCQGQPAKREGRRPSIGTSHAPSLRMAGRSRLAGNALHSPMARLYVVYDRY